MKNDLFRVVFLRICLLLFFTFVLSCHSEKPVLVSGFAIEKAWIRIPPKGAKVTAAYFSIQNESGKEEKILKLTSDFANRLEMHTVEEVDSMIQMKKMEFLVLPQNEKVLFETNGKHLMVYEIHRALQEGEIFLIHFEMESGKKISVPFLAKLREDS